MNDHTSLHAHPFPLYPLVGGTGATGGFGTSQANPSGGMFGQPTGGAQPGAFGAPAAGPTGGFGTTTGAFGSQPMGAAGGMNFPPAGTSQPPFSPFQERDPTNNLLTFQCISAMPAYKSWSLEELRYQDYLQGRKSANQGAGFGGAAASGPGGMTGFGAPTTGAGAFGQPQQPAFGGGAFGSSNGGAFGQQQPGTGAFGGGGAFGQPSSTTAGSAFGGGGAFGATKPATAGAFGKWAVLYKHGISLSFFLLLPFPLIHSSLPLSLTFFI